MNRAARACAALGASGALHLLLAFLALALLRASSPRLPAPSADRPARLEIVPVTFSEAVTEDEAAPTREAVASAPSAAVPQPAEAAWPSTPLVVPDEGAAVPHPKAPADRPAPLEPTEVEPAEAARDGEVAEASVPSPAAPRQARVEVPPAPGRAIRPRYPAGARRRGEEGNVTLRLAVDVQGAVVGVEVLSPRAFPALVAAATEAARRAAFRPAQRDGQPVPGTVDLTFTFRLRD